MLRLSKCRLETGVAFTVARDFPETDWLDVKAGMVTPGCMDTGRFPVECYGTKLPCLTG